MNKISLIIPCYQSDINLLNQALECSDLFDEVIVHINDKVTAKKFEMPKSKLGQDLCKIIWWEERISVQDALNGAIYYASGDFILPFTDDDFFHRKNLQYAIDFAKKSLNLYDVIHYPIWSGNDVNGWKKWGDDSNINYNKLLEENYIPFSCMYRKDAWLRVGGYKNNMPFSDWFFWLEMVAKRYQFYYLDNPVYYHREGHKETLSQKESKTFNKEEFLKGIK